ncbi:MAG: hypothetical protein SFV24_02910 [Gemmatimonadales bacterium]|nr:hypothetical protein [Gemmatimonadales bacterium]
MRPLGVVVGLALLAGCYQYVVTPPNPEAGTEYRTRTGHSLFWGLVKSRIETPEAVCQQSQTLADVTVSSNLGYSLLTIATLGIWSPMTVKYRCGKRQTGPGAPPDAPAAPAGPEVEP